MCANRCHLQQASGFKRQCFNSSDPSNFHVTARVNAAAAGCLQYHIDNRAGEHGHGRNSMDPCAKSLPFHCARVFEMHYTKPRDATNVTTVFQATKERVSTHTCLLRRGIVEYAIVIRNYCATPTRRATPSSLRRRTCATPRRRRRALCWAGMRVSSRCGSIPWSDCLQRKRSLPTSWARQVRQRVFTHAINVKTTPYQRVISRGFTGRK